MKKLRKIATLATVTTILFSSMTVNATTLSITAKQNADYMMSTNKDEAPNWFNGTYYSEKYTDLKVTFNDNEKALYNHSLSNGFNEERLVTPVLDVVKYRAFYPDLDNAFGNNWKLYVRHYFEYGIAEGRYNFTDFNARTYLSMYPDLQNAFGDDLGLATRHYIEHGIAEGRAYHWPEPEVIYESEDEESENSNSSSTGNSSTNNDSTNNSSIDENFTGDKRIEHPDGSYRIVTYVNGVLAVITWYDSNSEESSRTEFTYDASGNMTASKTTMPDGSIREETYENNYRKTYTKYRLDGTKLIYNEFDENGNTTLSIEYQEDGITENVKSSFTYDENNNLILSKSTWADGSTNESTYENDVYTHQVNIHADGTKVESEFYSNGQTIKKETKFCTDGTKIISEFYENSNWKSYTEYDASDNMTRQQLYDEAGNLTSDITYTPVTQTE
ncbi:MAG: hypothetical protein IJ379_03600 [Lachnospiraceae bacterium]|nr:hypothetical protein [Lachnospiraceae bacterium]